jgi:hypothetical protein
MEKIELLFKGFISTCFTNNIGATHSSLIILFHSLQQQSLHFNSINGAFIMFLLYTFGGGRHFMMGIQSWCMLKHMLSLLSLLLNKFIAKFLDSFFNAFLLIFDTPSYLCQITQPSQDSLPYFLSFILEIVLFLFL